MPDSYGYDSVQETVAAIRSRDDRSPDIALILGSGLGPFADTFDDRSVIPYTDLPHFPSPSVAGHAGNLVIGRVGEGAGARTVVAMQGRVHRYEGWPLDVVVFPVRVMRALGARVLVVTNASGGVNEAFAPGELMVITDHLNLTGENPLFGPNDERFGPRFPDMSYAFTEPLRDVLLAVGGELGQTLRQGVYAGLRGPSYETPAEIRMCRTLGGDAVGMSTIPEVIAACHMGMPTCGISCITNLGAGLGDGPLSHAEVQEVAREAHDRMSALLARAIPRLPLEPPSHEG